MTRPTLRPISPHERRLGQRILALMGCQPDAMRHSRTRVWEHSDAGPAGEVRACPPPEDGWVEVLGGPCTIRYRVRGDDGRLLPQEQVRLIIDAQAESDRVPPLEAALRADRMAVEVLDTSHTSP